jgi:hypothetical protein
LEQRRKKGGSGEAARGCRAQQCSLEVERRRRKVLLRVVCRPAAPNGLLPACSPLGSGSSSAAALHPCCSPSLLPPTHPPSAGTGPGSCPAGQTAPASAAGSGAGGRRVSRCGRRRAHAERW